MIINFTFLVNEEKAVIRDFDIDCMILERYIEVKTKKKKKKQKKKVNIKKNKIE